jgi:hypothetical protein
VIGEIGRACPPIHPDSHARRRCLDSRGRAAARSGHCCRWW